MRHYFLNFLVRGLLSLPSVKSLIILFWEKKIQTDFWNFLDTISPHQVERGVSWRKLFTTDPEIDVKEVIVIVIFYGTPHLKH